MANDIHKPSLSSKSMADATYSIRHVFVRDYETIARIGVWDHEKERTQKVRINVDLSVSENETYHEDQLDNVLCYFEIVKGIEAIIASGHINLVETLAENIAEFCLKDLRVRTARVRVEKLEAIEKAVSVGVEVERHQNS
ncbi:dihydroneopterin aldolase [Temperatibacter marinus]|uniref:7,8-dihydroneopterin aldolase n=1 Tax=Temperatibacter marinus TaxID=1456591 RepID=A0AA52EGG9_9PROT|nr:dihydroneopterin aldolase [Temperatibacter marinus]WND01631.1 dihydroneopterin aldolase [Temperatibacter marinus]